MSFCLLHTEREVLELTQFAILQNILDNIEIFSTDFERFSLAKIQIFSYTFDDDCFLASSQGSVFASSKDGFELLLDKIQRINPCIRIWNLHLLFSNWKVYFRFVFMTEAVFPQINNLRVDCSGFTKHMLINNFALAKDVVVQPEIRVFKFP